MINEVVVRIIADRILNKGENPKTHKEFILDDIINAKYKKAVEDYIITHNNVI